MKMIPKHVYRFPSRAEEKVFGLLADSTRDGCVFHSMNVASHGWKPWTEIDFVCVTSFGLLAIEVKGGRISRHEGHWFTNDKPLKESPFGQVQAATFELMRGVNLDYASFGWAVVMPDSANLPTTSEHPRELQAVYSDCRTPESFSRWLAVLEDYWIEKLRNHRMLDSRGRSELMKRLRPNFDAAIPLGEQADAMEQQALQFTEEQFSRLDEIEENDQILCRGGAGTGKTFLAIEVAKRESTLGRHVLLVSRNLRLVDWISRQLDLPYVKVSHVDSLSSLHQHGKQFDVLVVDEGQDLLSLAFIDQLDRLLKGGFSNGRWRWFMDDQYQSGFHEDIDPSAVDLLQDRGVTLQRLRVNCRNTRQIVEFTQYTTGADIGQARLSGGGEVPQFEFVKPMDEASRLTARLQAWHDEDVDFSRMMVLVCDTNRLSQVRHDVNSRVSVATVRDFKGLEAEFVALVGIPEGEEVLDRITNELYTGFTRARVALWVAVPASLEQEWTDARLKHARRKVEIEFGRRNDWR